MKIRNIALSIMLLIFLSGEFSIEILNTGLELDVKYILFFLCILISVIGNIKNKKSIFKKTNHNEKFIYILFFLYTFLSTATLLWTPNVQHSIEKYIALIFLNLLIISYFFIIENFKPRDFYRLTSIFFILIGVLYSVPVFISIILGASRGDILLSGPNVTTRIIFFAVCSSLYQYNIKKENKYFLLSVFFLSSIVLVGSRGGLVGAIICLFLISFLKLPNILKKMSKVSIPIRKLSLIPMIIFIFFLVYEPVQQVFNERIIGVTFNSGEVYTSGRDIIYGNAINLIKEKPLVGHGIDSFENITGWVYPHNLLLEMMIEIGLAGALIFIGFFIYSLICIFKFRKTLLFPFSIIPLYMIIVQMFSGEFYDFRYYFLWIIPLLHYDSEEKESLIKKTDKNYWLYKL